MVHCMVHCMVHYMVRCMVHYMVHHMVHCMGHCMVHCMVHYKVHYIVHCTVHRSSLGGCIAQCIAARVAEPYLDAGGPPSSQPTVVRRRTMSPRQTMAHATKMLTEKPKSPAGTAKAGVMPWEYLMRGG